MGDFSGSDLLDLHLPFKYSLSRSLSLWEPRMSMGFPLMAEGQTGVFYPPNLLLSYLPPFLALNLSIILAFLTAGIFTYLYTRSLGYSRYASLFCAVTFAFSAFFVTRLKHISMIVVSAWMPFLFWTIKKLFATQKILYAILASLGIAIQILAGHPEMAFFTIFITLIYFIHEAVDTKSIPLALKSILYFTVIPLLLSSIQLLPSIEFTLLSERTQFSYSTATAYPFRLQSLLTFIAPYYSGNPATGTYKEDISSSGIFWENSSYIGLLPIILAIWGIFKAPRFFQYLAVFSLLLMLGSGTPVYGFIWKYIPGFSLFRFPNRFNLFLIFSLCIVAASAIDKLVAKLISLHFQPKTANETDEFKFSWPLKIRPTQTLILGFAFLDLLVFAQSYISYIPVKDFLKPPAAAQTMATDSARFRVYSLTQYGQSPYGTIGWAKNPQAILDANQTLPPNQNIIYNLDSFTDRSWFEGGLGLERRSKLENFILKENQNPVLTGKILGMFNVKYLLSFSESLGIEINPLQSYTLSTYATPLILFENNQFMPRVYFTPEAEVVKNGDAALEKIKSPDLLPIKTVILETEPKNPTDQFSGIIDEFVAANPVTITDYQNQKITIKANVKSHGFLVLSDIYYPGWKVIIDGKPDQILRANYLVRAIELDPGDHQIVFTYDPWSFKLGAIISVISLGLVSLLLIFQISRSGDHNRLKIITKSP